MRSQFLKIEGHRGAITNAHENTLEAFLEAERLKVDGIEFDLWLTKDKVPVISHGKTTGGLEILLSKTTNKLEYVFLPYITYEGLKNYVYPTSQASICTLEEVLISLKDSHMYLNLELKDHSQELIEEILNIIQSVKPSVKITFSSFNLRLRQILDEMCLKVGLPRFPFGYLIDCEHSLPCLDSLSNQIIPSEDSINVDIQFVLLNNEKIRNYLKKASTLGLSAKCYNLMALTDMEDGPMYEALVEFGIETFICNRVERLIEYNQGLLGQD
jgi:glycerophosphoryl diester phosphodiesterase